MGTAAVQMLRPAGLWWGILHVSTNSAHSQFRPGLKLPTLMAERNLGFFGSRKGENMDPKEPDKPEKPDKPDKPDKPK